MAAAQKAIAEQQTQLPPLPAECYIDTPHAPLTVGAEARVTLARERQQLNVANDKRYRCASFYNNLSPRSPGS